MSLALYNKKRNFKKTPEPFKKGKVPSSKLTFVVQRHDASHLHFDFRLQLHGVLKSWAIPKGPSLNPKDKRLAVMVEDHPLGYASFKGTIPQGNYGAGEVEIWDRGTYELDEQHVGTKHSEKEIQKGIDAGSLKLVMHGKKLKGSFALVRLKDGKEKNWLLIKHKDEYAVNTEYHADENRTIKKTDQGAESKSKKPFRHAARSVRSQGVKVPNFVLPMLAHIKDQAFDDDDWLFEIKWDGYRAIAEVEKKGVRLYSRNGLSFSELYPVIAKELTKIKDDVILDGEIIVLGKDGKPSFQKLQHYDDNRELVIQYQVFDCLSYRGNDITHLPLLERKDYARKAIPKNNILKYSDHVEKTGVTFFKSVMDMGLEGMMAKRTSSIYVPGKRTQDWLKVRNHKTQEAIIAGYTAPRDSRQYFGALILGIMQNKNLVYIGHTGTGFTDKLLKELHARLQPIIRKRSPFDKKIPVNAAVTWVDPMLVCNVKFTEITEDGILRHPVFMGLRIDKSAKEVDHLEVIGEEVKENPKEKEMKTSSKVAVKGNTTSKASSKLTLTNQEKIYFPKEGLTKGDVVKYYSSVSKYILPYLKDRPESLKRNPNGIDDKGFFHKDAGEGAPPWVQSIEIYSEAAHKDINYILCNNKDTLMYLNNLGCIEINPWNSRIKTMDNPDYLIIDIDPSEKNTFEEVIEVARVIKDILDKASAVSYCKTSGASGLHVYVPLKAAYPYDQARAFAEIVASLVLEQLPKTTTMERSLSKRKNRIYIDYLQNKRGQTLASVYSLRPVPGATVSTPLNWKEVKSGLSPSKFTIHNTLKRIEKMGDLFQGVLKEKVNIEKCLKKLGG
jgi:bifunctional non-homologous end joining protein LigD